MKLAFRLYLIAVLMLSDFRLFAQPGMDDPNGNLEGTNDPPPAPINTLWVMLAITGILFVMYKFRQAKKTT